MQTQESSALWPIVKINWRDLPEPGEDETPVDYIRRHAQHVNGDNKVLVELTAPPRLNSLIDLYRYKNGHLYNAAMFCDRVISWHTTTQYMVLISYSATTVPYMQTCNLLEQPDL